MHRFQRIILCATASLLFFASAVPAQAAPEDPPNESLVAGWLARTLASTNDVALTPTGDPDYAFTAYAILGMRAVGVAGDQILASASALAASGEAFISNTDEIRYKTTAISLMILAMQVAGLDPSQYPTESGIRDLYTDLGSAINPGGSISGTPSAYGQSFGILALLGSPSGVPQMAIDWLLEQPCTDTSSPGYGGYGFSGPGSCDDVDPDSTALAVIALMAAGTDRLKVELSGAYLASVQDPSGGFISPWSGANANTTGLVVTALKALTGFESEATQGENFLISLIYGCDMAGDSATAPIVGAMAFDSASRTSNVVSPLADDVRGSLFQASAQGIWGLGGLALPIFSLPPLTSDVPDASACSGGITPTQSPSSPEPNQPSTTWWWWVLGGIVVVVVVFSGWRFLVSRRK